MKRTLALILMLVMMASVFAACGNTAPSSAATAPAEETKAEETPAETAEAPAAVEFEKVTLRLGHNNSTEHFIHKAAEKFAQVVNERTNGAVTIEVYPAETIGTEREMIDAMVIGEGIDFYVGSTSPFTAIDERFSFFEGPYLFDSREHLSKFYNSDFMQKTLNDELAENCKVRSIAEIYYGTRQTTCSKPCETVEDFVGLKFRVPTSQIFLDYADALGSAATPITFSECYLALQQGVADAQENPLASIESMKFYEVQQYLIKTGHMVQENHVFFSEFTREKLQPEVVDIILQAAKEVGQEYCQVSYDLEDSLEAQLIDQGMEVINVDQAAFREKMAPVYDKWRDIWGQDLFDAIDAARA